MIALFFFPHRLFSRPRAPPRPPRPLLRRARPLFTSAIAQGASRRRRSRKRSDQKGGKGGCGGRRRKSKKSKEAREEPPPPPPTDRSRCFSISVCLFRHYVRFLAAALATLGHSLVLSDRHGEKEREKEGRWKRKGEKRRVCEKRESSIIDFFFFLSFFTCSGGKSLSFPFRLSFPLSSVPPSPSLSHPCLHRMSDSWSTTNCSPAGVSIWSPAHLKYKTRSPTFTLGF